jgi:predicted ribosome quality control (RQC) complex YloA/Tae2 family protein
LHAGAAWEPPPARSGEEGRGPDLQPEAGAPFPLSAAVERHYLAEEEARRLVAARRRLREPLRAAVARARRALGKLAEEAARVPAAEEDRRIADLLKQNLHALRRGQPRAELTEWTAEGPRPVAVALDPALTPQQNMERFYRRYRRIAESAAQVEARAAAVRERLLQLEPLLAAVDATPPGELPRLEREARRLGAAPRPQAPPGRRAREAERLPYRTFRALGGALVLVGRSAADNDALTVRVAKGNDVWLHARGHAGSHVVVRLPRGSAGPDQETLLDAAHLAAWFSDARGAPDVDVAWTRAKHVRKPRGAAPGAVTYSQDRTLLLRVEPARIERLLAAEEQAPG